MTCRIAEHSRTHRAPLLLALMLAGAPALAADCATRILTAFDADAKAGPGWAHVPLSKLKRDTVYSTAQENGSVILKATAEGAASAYVHLAPIDPARLPVIEWRWRTDALIGAADNRNPKLEDAPVRVIVGFDGDKTRLPEQEQRRFNRAKTLSGRDLPYATLMYIWENRAPVGTVIPSTHTAQLKMIVAESGPQGVGAWRTYQRNLVQDYQRAFGTAPGRILGVAVMTDTDNTDSKAEGFYGEIRFTCASAAK
ncbi:MAG: DUF3047 domain-containing protein [Burkholderiaceae bacterium]|nr:DUF3047 domain-containing protein [Burkholderiaceae bacterium]